MPGFDELLTVTEHGLYCPAGDFHIDPRRKVPVAFITHAHTDHARPGCGHYVTAARGAALLRARVGAAASIAGVAYGEALTRGGVRVSLHPAGHMLGSAQVRIEAGGYVLVISGDYKTDSDPTCDAFEPQRCHAFVTECTFGLPIYRWPPAAEVFAEINAWWQRNQAEHVTSVLCGYALGKAQRLLAGVDATLGPLLVHRTLRPFLEAYAAAGVGLPPARIADAESLATTRGRALVIAPPTTGASGWLRRGGQVRRAFASGWMQLRGPRRRGGYDCGFVLSDHADWDGLLWAIRQTGASTVAVTHGHSAALVRWLSENGYHAFPLKSRYDRKTADIGDPPAPAGLVDAAAQPHTPSAESGAETGSNRPPGLWTSGL